MTGRPTHDQALDALCDPEFPVLDALALFDRAHRRSTEFTKGFILHFAGVIRAERRQSKGVTTTDTLAIDEGCQQ